MEDTLSESLGETESPYRGGGEGLSPKNVVRHGRDESALRFGTEDYRFRSSAAVQKLKMNVQFAAQADTLGGTSRSFNPDFKGGMGTGRSAGASDMDGAGDDDGDRTGTGTPAFALCNDGGEVLISPELSIPTRRKTTVPVSSELFN